MDGNVAASAGCIDVVDISVNDILAGSSGGCDHANITKKSSFNLASDSVTSEAVPVPDGGSSSHEGCDHVDTEEKIEKETVATAPDTLSPTLVGGSGWPSGPDVCAICLNKIKLAETSQIKGCEHSYCVTCILRWALYKENTWCPQCRLPFTELYVYRALDGSLNDYLFEESVCLLLRASWFEGMPVFTPEKEEAEDYYEDDDFDDYYCKSNVRIGNRRWGDNGYVRAGRREARPVGVRHLAAAVAQADGAASSSISPGKTAAAQDKAPAKEATTGRRAKRAQKRAAIGTHQAPQRSAR